MAEDAAAFMAAAGMAVFTAAVFMAAVDFTAGAHGAAAVITVPAAWDVLRML